MARLNKKLKKMDQDHRTAIMMHVRALNLRTIEEYASWCQENGFSTGVKKSLTQRSKEYSLNKSKAADEALKKHSKESKLRTQITQIFNKELKYGDVNSDVLNEIIEGFRKSRHPKSLYELLMYLEFKTKFLHDVSYLRGIIGLVNHRSRWVRRVEDWEPKTHNTDRQFSSFIRHLVATYDVPLFMDNAWYQGNNKHQDWFIHIGKGSNIRTANKLPFVLTKKMAHYFLQAPSNHSVHGALRLAQILALGGNRRLANAVNETRLVRRFKDDAFWLSVIRLFIANPMLDVAHVNPIVDYIWNQKYENRIEFVERGVAREIEPAQPNFSMSGRTADTLLRQVDSWHRQLGRESRGGDLQWKRSDINDFKFVEGNAKRTSMKIWRIHELLSSKELVAEGRAQGHCVASYARSCFTGRSAIFTMNMQDKNSTTKMVTIEVSLPSKQVIQVRGKHNRVATDKEENILQRWAEKESIKGINY